MYIYVCFHYLSPTTSKSLCISQASQMSTLSSSLVYLLLLASLCLPSSGPRLVTGIPPGPVVQCTSGNTNCLVHNGYGAFLDGTNCRVAAAAYPSTESELLRFVSDASLANQKMKVVTRYSHSIPKLCCPGGPDGTGLVISTEKLNHVVRVDVQSRRITVESGITLHELIEAGATHGLALTHSPYWLGLSLGGMLCTGAHGSSFVGKGGAVHEYVVGMKIVVPTTWPDVDGYFAKVISLEEDDPDLLAAKVSLGVLGVISQVTLQMEPMFKRSITHELVADDGLEDYIERFGRTTEFGDITWYPEQKRLSRRVDFRVPLTEPGNGENDFTGYRSLLSTLTESLRKAEEVVEATKDSVGKCLAAKGQVEALYAMGAGLKNNIGNLVEFTGYPVVGNHSMLQASGSCLFDKENSLLTACAWDPRIHGQFFTQLTISIPLTSISSFIIDVKKLRDMAPQSLCAIEMYGGILMRFITASTAYLGQTTDVVDLEITYYRDHDPSQPRLHEDVLEELEQIVLFKYGGMPHWGKNRNIAFLGTKERFQGRIEKFVEVMKKFDPKGLFSSEWSDSVLGLQEKGLVIEKPGCALEGLCVCSLDSHCAPDKGYFCRPGLVYAEARVCRHEA
ncbi:L-gulonolactone oxidase 2-like isoform X1 [Nymphaea colorata]|nr:L-gulonolactone oxidase 2-like isoform X1 [Nymphaea colorata]